MLILSRIVSGGQTGVDRAALDVALEWGVPCGGWCPPGRAAEEGLIPLRYPLSETPENTSTIAPDVPNSQRTEWNVRDADGTLVLTRGNCDRGTALTMSFAARQGKPLIHVNLEHQPLTAEPVCRWMEEHRVRVLNVAGPRESIMPGIHAAAAAFLRELFKALKEEA